MFRWLFDLIVMLAVGSALAAGLILPSALRRTPWEAGNYICAGIGGLLAIGTLLAGIGMTGEYFKRRKIEKESRRPVSSVLRQKCMDAGGKFAVFVLTLILWPQLLIEHIKELERRGYSTGFLTLPLLFGLVWMLALLAVGIGAVMMVTVWIMQWLASLFG